MDDRKAISEKASAFFDDIWKRGDFWQLETSEFERQKYACQMRLLQSKRYRRVLEIGCGSGCFSRLLASTADHVVAMDVSSVAIQRARAAAPESSSVEFQVMNIMEYDPAANGPWDLVVMSETIYYLGWLYPVFDVAWLAAQLCQATSTDGWLLMANTYGGPGEYLAQPWLIRTYRDLFLNVGYQLDSEEIFRGAKGDTMLEVLVSLFAKRC